jgi:acyl-coenzyme A synthetase/AMP-(fatty) acid ligase
MYKLVLFQVEDYSWRIARVFKKRGFVKGDVVALVCTNRPEYVMTWIGLARLGVVTSLVNTNLRHEALKHSLNVCNPHAVIVSIDLIHGKLHIF